MNNGKPILNQLAHEYSSAAGAAFQRGEDERAREYREWAKRIQQLATELPPLPQDKR